MSKIDNKWRDFKDSEWARFLISRVDFPSFRPNIETGFCNACSSIDFLADGFDLGRTLHDLQDGSEDCTMCSFLFQCFSTVSTATVVQGQQNLSLSHNNTPAISFYVDPGSSSTDVDSRVLTMIRLSRPDSTSSPIRLTRSSLTW